MTELQGDYLTIDQAGKVMKRKATLVRTLCREGRFHGAKKMGHTWLIPRIEAETYQPAKRGVKPQKAKLAAEKAAILEQAKGTGKEETA